jgi:hypothetical protein
MKLICWILNTFPTNDRFKVVWWIHWLINFNRLTCKSNLYNKMPQDSYHILKICWRKLEQISIHSYNFPEAFNARLLFSMSLTLIQGRNLFIVDSKCKSIFFNSFALISLKLFHMGFNCLLKFYHHHFMLIFMEF